MDYLARQFLSGIWRKSVVIPVGGIILWSGSIASIPVQWALCDGSNGTPDLRDMFLVGAGSTHAVGATGGANTNDLRHAHDDGTLAAAVSGAPTSGAEGGAVVTVRSSTHAHDITGDTGSAGSAAQENRPAFYALAFIMRIS